eukprot:TRINITY_DN3591_c0_g2_i4.p2 TRINITY_DN3591_c0_g2~~TRINITY_DN3591_c0_g2_i4.p2  ORF type:complete len:101 (-),score=33.80 TRINITY_DN3591_c0_g2_i4:229-531(-)
MLVRKFYELTYDRDCNISTPEGAAVAIEECGFGSAGDAVEWLRRGGGEKEVAASLQQARQINIRSVPHYIMRGDGSSEGEQMSGAQDSNTFYSMIQQIAR